LLRASYLLYEIMRKYYIYMVELYVLAIFIIMCVYAIL